ncbi:alpha/beta hydrolase [Paenarthrobacter sp. MMS21-TAE1-1]|uniref:Alpha/beta hydrolase n=2 Tax=Paenarthrobacter aromaticivorans TaxID=2849150 RepID=A0ABS6I8U7_9MICC|nr:alpha/beta hydrolase [Paenarthrobacter sp. MMS21-TAE1-1]
MAHGWGMVSGGDLEDYAGAIVGAGLAALTFDFRHLGASEGEPRQDIDPYRQIEDYRAAISYVRTRPEVEGERIGVWGSSYSGGHALVTAAIDRRVRCVVAQVPTISGWQAAQQRVSVGDLAAQREWFTRDREARFAGAKGQTITMISADPSEKVAYPGEESYDYMSAQGKICPNWRNEVSVRSLELARTYEPGAYIERIAPTPLLMIIADADTTTPTGLQQNAYQRAYHPKRLLLVPGGHYSVYTEHFEETSKAAAEWFGRHLEKAPKKHWSDEDTVLGTP